MIKSILRDTFFLSQASEEATKSNLPLGKDMQDTLTANADRVGCHCDEKTNRFR